MQAIQSPLMDRLDTGPASVQSEISSDIVGLPVAEGELINDDLPTCSQQSSSAIDSDIELCPRPTPLWKRFVDVGASLFLLVTLAPLLLAIAAYIRIVSRGPIIFSQPRLGLMGQEFTIYKFRTLKCSETATSDHRQFVAKLSETDGVLTKPDLTSRMIPGGSFLRQTSLDELPQLWNILTGSMSLVGPRPDVLDWHDYRPEHRRRFEVVPGVTGLWQVSGKNRLTFEQMIEKDVQYVDNRSMWLDFRILMVTFRLLVQRDNK